MIEPLPCPRCGESSHVVHRPDWYDETVTCLTCYDEDVIIGRGKTMWEALEDWNEQVELKQ